MFDRTSPGAARKLFQALVLLPQKGAKFKDGGS